MKVSKNIRGQTACMTLALLLFMRKNNDKWSLIIASYE